MNGGKLEQIGTPEEIFHQPASRFVGRFLGLADFLRARSTEKGLQTEIGVVPTEMPVALGTDVDVMVRPDDISIHPADSGKGRITSRVFRGMHYLYNVILPSGAVVHSIQAHTAYFEEGTPVEVSLEPHQLLTCFVVDRSGPDAEHEQTFQVSTGNGALEVG
jgi:iron(III) transport system ATP-binding protein